MQRFKAQLKPVPGGGNFVIVPPEIASAAGLRYGVRVRGALDGIAYRSSLMMYSGIFHLGVHKATMAAAGVGPGANVDVTIELDDKPLPTDTVPNDLERALKVSKLATDGWSTTSPSHRREYVKHVTEAKKPETRERRIASTIEALEAHAAKRAKPKVGATRAKPKVGATRAKPKFGATRAKPKVGATRAKPKLAAKAPRAQAARRRSGA